ncbi:MAG TPA: DUF362 domain-containing protein, partial [Chloroflexota bacterium]|nr:DUF362 domain-containing protein [Chloroflexota bacterium]
KPSDDEIRRHCGRFVSCSEPAVTRAVVALVREANPTADIVFAEGIDFPPHRTAQDVFRAMDAVRLVEEFGVRLVNANEGEICPVPVPGGGLIHRAVYLHREVADVDAVVSVAKLKAHGTAGVTMSVKNMFGILPFPYYGSTFRNFMHTNYFRLMRVIVDTATTLRPDLAVVDGLIASNFGMDHEPVEMNVLLAGHDPVATDAVGAAVMGFDPHAEFPVEPFLVSENHLRLAARAGVGVLDLPGTEVRGVAIGDVARQFSIETEEKVTTEQAIAGRSAAIAQAAVYRARHAELLREYAGRYVYLRDGNVEWSSPTLADAADRAILHLPAGEYGLAIQVLPEDQAIEKISAYG